MTRQGCARHWIAGAQRLVRHLLRVGIAAAYVAVAIAPAAAVTIVDDQYEERPQFKITTDSATWYYDKAGGGFSRLVDRQGIDWIAFHKEPLKESPASAAAGFRGLPNLVHQLEDGGAGHPGFDRCTSEKLDERAIRTVSHSGKWQWTWRFTETYAEMTVDRVDAARAYWFLYEGPIGGRFSPATVVWGADLGGPRRDTPDHILAGAINDCWQWVYFGDTRLDRVLFVAQVERDELLDAFSLMGSTRAGLAAPDGMAVFGFGRGPGAKKSLTAEGLRFVVGFIEEKVETESDHERVAAAIDGVLKELDRNRTAASD